MKRYIAYLAALLLVAVLFVPALALAQAVPYASGSITTQNLVPAGVATAGSAVEVTTLNASGIVIQVTGTYTGALSVQITNDSATWVTIAGTTAIVNAASAASAATIASATPGVYYLNIPGTARARVTALAAVTGTAVVTVRATTASKIN